MRVPLVAVFLLGCGSNHTATPSPPPGVPAAAPAATEAAAGTGVAEDPSDPWSMFSGRIGRLRSVNGTMVAVFGAEDPRFVGHLPEQDNYGDGWMEAKIVTTAKHPAPSNVLGIPRNPKRDTGTEPYAIELGAAVEVYDRYVRNVGDPFDELAGRGFVVVRCGGKEAVVGGTGCYESDPFIVGPVRTMTLPKAPTDRAPENVRRTYAGARNYKMTDAAIVSLRSVPLDTAHGVYWVSADQSTHVVWTSHPATEDGLFLHVEPSAVFVAGDSVVVESLDDPPGRDDRRFYQLIQFRPGHRSVTYGFSSGR